MAVSKKATKLTQMINPMTDGNEHLRKESEDEEVFSTRLINQDDKTLFVVEAVNPEGHWRIVPTKGKLPEELKGKYTTQTVAKRTIEAYLNKMG